MALSARTLSARTLVVALLCCALAAAAPAGTVPYFIAQTPDVLTGLLLGLVLLLFLAIGVSCIMGISNPDQLFEKDQALPAGKEY